MLYLLRSRFAHSPLPPRSVWVHTALLCLRQVLHAHLQLDAESRQSERRRRTEFVLKQALLESVTLTLTLTLTLTRNRGTTGSPTI